MNLLETSNTKLAVDECDGDSAKDDVLDYLCNVFDATKKLIQAEEREDTLMELENDATMSITDIETPSSPNEYIYGISKNLVDACDPLIFGCGISNLPTINTFQFDESFGNENDLVEDLDFFYEYRRSDYLRRLLRVLAPISMEITAKICSTVISNRRSGSSSETKKQQQRELGCVILFSHWLPVAPHLTPMVTEMFKSINNPFRDLPSESRDGDEESKQQMFVEAEAFYKICSFFASRGEISTLRGLRWEWTYVFKILHDTGDTIMDDQVSVECPNHSGSGISSFVDVALKWFSVRILSLLMGWNASITRTVLKSQNVDDDRVPWQMHPWEIDQEEVEIEKAYFQRQVFLWNDSITFKLPSSENIQAELQPSPYLAIIGPGIAMYKEGSFRKCSGAMGDNVDSGEDGDNIEADQFGSSTERSRLILTSTTNRNLALLGAAMCHDPHPRPILVCGPQGSGKSSLIRELLRLCRPRESLIEFHIDEETDSKTLIGSYTTTDIPGEFAWRAGALTNASREGRWVLIEDLDTVPLEIQAALVKLFEERMVPLGNGKYERCHPNFRIFATCTTSASSSSSRGQNRHSLRIGNHRGGGKQILNPTYWTNVHVKPMPYSELKEVATSLFSNAPISVIDSAMTLLQALDRSGRERHSDSMEDDDKNEVERNIERMRNMWVGVRIPSVRDFFKLLSRICNGMCFERDTAYTTEAQRTLCMAESVDIFMGSCPDQEVKDQFVGLIAAPVWGITKSLALNYMRARKPSVLVAADFFEIGRAKFHTTKSIGFSEASTSSTYAETSHALRLMESIAVCVRENEPILLVGETGCGKTTNIQQLATRCERTLVVQNLSLQTDSTDLLGGYRPLEIQNVARNVYKDFVDTFVSSFSRKQNLKFLQYASSMLEKSNWKKLSQCFKRAAQLGLKKMSERNKNHEDSDLDPLIETWQNFSKTANRFERQRLSCDAGLAFEFVEGALVDAIQTGKWVLLDEINLASSDTLQRLCGLLDEPTGSITLTERGDATAIKRHPNFRLFAAMNPATDAGKKDLPASIRCRFSELYVDELLDPIELRLVVARCLDGVLPTEGNAPEHTEIVACIVDQYLRCRELAQTTLSDGNGHKPRYTLRTLSRALKAAKNLIIYQRIRLKVAIFEGFQLSFEGILDAGSIKTVRKMLTKAFLREEAKKINLDHPGRRPGGKGSEDEYILLKPFWIKAGPLKTVDWSEIGANGKSKFILTKTATMNLRRLARAIATGPWPILLEGPTSSGKTTLVEYIAARCGHYVVRINNHEHTDVQEYTGAFAADQNGSLSFRDGILVQALRQGHWVILDELNLAPSEVLEALNRLLDDNRELYLAETNEIVKPHPNFRLFATQNPSGAYGGRKPLSRAFRNRFVELHVGDIPSDEMATILEKRCACPPSHAKLLVKIMVDLRLKRSKMNLFLGKDSFITPRDLLRWAERQCGSKKDLAEHGYMVLAERLRSEEEKQMVRDVLQEHTKVKIDLERLYYDESSESKQLLDRSLAAARLQGNHLIASIAPTRSMLRLIHLVSNCVKQKEPVLLVGDTGCGKTTVIQLLSFVLDQKLFTVNCHATTETSDLIGGLRPVRGRDSIKRQIVDKLKELIKRWPYDDMLNDLKLDQYISEDKLDDEQLGDEMYDVSTMVALAKTISSRRPEFSNDGSSKERTKKRRKMTESSSPGDKDSDHSEVSENEVDLIAMLAIEIEELGRQFMALFEWSDGPLVKAMKSGHLMLLDEMSLAEDAVLERLNSVLEPSRLLVLAEKGDDGSSSKGKDSRIIIAHDSFRIFATMNPGGDYGKRELSPALRSRFTEIWVPSISERRDFEIVLGRSLTLNLEPQTNFKQSWIISRILDYVEWFNSDICGAPSSPYASFSLSLRDILSWANFIAEARKSNAGLTIWDALYHGACLMHLDGLGLGSGLASDSSTALKLKAEQYLSNVLGNEKISNAHSVDEPICIQNGKFGVFPYFINIGKSVIPKSTFNMAAPTTSLNAFRVLRAMQLKKPILLEGSPGVGKTSLVNALASASGNKLVRINLSEQTDVSDLMGSDLPVEDSRNNGPSFEWCDGVLLTAIKEGSWVLLDELNLASQAVLEGLNSCLDHRATMYIPELGRSFDCPSTFRIFAAQNPLGQGGGRKGLPKSFLNRFTKVFVDALTESDLRSIVSSRFDSFSEDFVNKIIDFNNDIHHEVVHLGEYGSEGGPWEFNLRDVFRWCELIDAGHSSYAAGARDLYYQRFRNQEDRDRVDKTFQNHFGRSMISTALPEFEILDGSIQIGETNLSRLNPLDQTFQNDTSIQESELIFSHLVQMEAVARCINLRWPCLLVGGTGSGKTAIISSLASLCNATLVEHCLSPSSDVSELVGGFEQCETFAKDIQIIRDLCMLGRKVLMINAFKSVHTKSCLDMTVQLQRYVGDWDDNSVAIEDQTECPWKEAQRLSEVLETMVLENHSLSQFNTPLKDLKRKIQPHLDKKQTNQDRQSSGQFVWRDGILVEALLKGHWLLLENVNLCPASVLDRLNSVTEKDGFLLLSESGTQEGENSSYAHRIIKPHENFRIFFTMNAVNGEISRAMRNRCVEISLLESRTQNSVQSSNELPIIKPSFSEVQMVDFMSTIRSSRICSMEVASAVLNTYLNESMLSSKSFEDLPSLKGVFNSVYILSGLLCRGVDPVVSGEKFMQLSFEVEESDITRDFSSTIVEQTKSCDATPLPPTLILNSVGNESKTIWETRLLRMFTGKQSNVMDSMSKILNVQEKDTLEESTSVFPSSEELQLIVSQLFVNAKSHQELKRRAITMIGLQSHVAYTVKWMASALQESLSQSGCSRDHPYFQESVLLTWQRLHQLFIENEWIKSLTKRDTVLDSPNDLTVLEASYYIHENLLDQSAVPCSVTSLLYQFFLAIDNWTANVLMTSNHTLLTNLIPQLRFILDARDKLWKLLTTLQLNLDVVNGFAAFDESEFIVQWQWLQKKIPQTDFQGSSIQGWQQVDLLINAVDRAIFGGPRPAWSARAIRKKTMRPLVPRQSDHWEALFSLEALSSGCSLVVDHRFDPFQKQGSPIDLEELIRLCHPSLYVTTAEKFQLLAAICTLQLSWTGTNFGDCSWINEIDFPTKLKTVFDELKDSFEIQVASAKVDLDIQTIDNQLEPKILDDLRDISSATRSKIDGYCHLKTRLLSFFSKVQLSALAEFWCVHQEVNLCGELSKLLLMSANEESIRHGLISLKSGMKSLVETAISKTIWKVGDMQAYQLLIWASEGKSSTDISLKTLLRSLLPIILSTSTQHAFTGSFICPESISSELEMPDMWANDVTNNNYFDHVVKLEKENDVGNVRLWQSVRTQLLLNMVGKQLSLVKKPGGSKIYTVENAAHRETQSKEVSGMLSTLSISQSKMQLYAHHYILFDILTAVKNSLQENRMDPLLYLIENPMALAESSVDQIRSAGREINNQFFTLFWHDFIFPLLESLRLAWQEDLMSLEYKRQYSRASVYLGLLRLHLLTPCTPLDPGRAPLAKVSLITRHLADIQSRLVANRLHSGFVKGNFSHETPENNPLLDSVEKLSEKRKSQQKKVVERIESAPAFTELFQETREFLNTALGNSSVLRLVEELSLVKERGNEAETTKRHAQNWQRTAAAFCTRLSTYFSSFRDITLPLIDSIQKVQDGLFGLAHQDFDRATKSKQSCSEVFDELHQYPMKQDSGSIKLLLSAIGGGNVQSNSDCFQALCIAILSRLYLKKELVGLEEDEITVCSHLFTALANSWNVLLDIKEEDTSLEEMQERVFREQFPDHRKDFNGILEDKSEELHIEAAVKADDESPDVIDKPLTDAQIELLYQIYIGIFSAKRTFNIDSVRKIAFHSSYAAAYELQKDSVNPDYPLTGSERMGGHIFAICLSSINKAKMVRTYSYFRANQKVVDFHNEASPGMALSAAEPLEKLMARTTQLLTAFPGHSILVGLGKVCEKVNKLNIMTTPIGKVMTGLEVILKQAQDWEQHASEKVQIGAPLTAIGRLVSEWRKFELESWGELIQGRHNRRVSKAQKYWLRLRGILFTDMEAIEEIDLPDSKNGSWACKKSCIIPQWTWKGPASIRSKLFDVFDNTHTESLKELVKALDTFILTSPLGEFEERLKILKTCADERRLGQDTKSSWRLQQSRTLYSIWSYYNQYLPGMLQKLTDLRAPVEEKLKSETKLAKWDNQSYYALAESTERNQRKLMKILSQFDESLDLNVGVIIQQEGCLGLRSSIEAHDEFCTTFPSFTSMFPMPDVKKEYQFKAQSDQKHSFDLLSVDDKLINCPADGHIQRIAKYAHKMRSLSAKNLKRVDGSYIRVGGDEASSLCVAIFDRIESLRSNGTRPMKERALVDLFRQLKENGYKPTKWSTPSELKSIEQIFLLPTPKFGGKERDDAFGRYLVKAEEYYLKCITEVNGLKSETTMLGSKYMSRREMDSMVNLGYSGMHLLSQQRCLISTLLVENHDLKELILSFQEPKQSLPFNQSKLKTILKTFEDKQAFAFENLQQLSLLLESSKALQNEEVQNSWIRDSISKLKSLCSEPNGMGPKCIHFINWEMCQGIEKGKKQLIKARELVGTIRQECKNLSCLPLDPFDSCLNSIQQALESARASEELPKTSDQKSLEMPSSKSRGFCEKLSSLIEQVLVTYQILDKEVNSFDQPKEVPSITPDTESDCDTAIWDCHKKFLKACTNIDAKKLNENLFGLIELLRNLHESQSIQQTELDCCVGLVSNTSVLLSYLQQLFHSLLEDYLYFYFSTSKLNYVVLRLFRSLVAKGFCSDKTAEEDGEGEGDVKGMTFDDDNDGTGMGEGEGKKDVTDQIENEDQLAGLKSDKDDENDGNKQDESKQLNEEEADHGMEMEGDFDGEMYDLPEKPQDENEIEEQEGEELDTEMGEDANPDDQVVDEKMWNDSDDEDDINKEEEKFEEDSGVKGEALEDAMRTKEEEEGDTQNDNDDNPSNEDQRENNLDGDADEGKDEQDGEEINDDTEDKYEEQHNVDVRAEENAEGQEDPDDQMELDDNLELDEKDQDSNAEEMDVPETDGNLDNASLSDEAEGDDDNPEANESGDEENDDTENEKAVNKAEDPMDLENEGGNEPEKQEDDKLDESPIDKSSEEHGAEEVHGIRSKDGTDAIIEDRDDEEDAKEDTNDENEVNGNPSGGKSDGDQMEMDGTDGGGYSNHQINEENDTKSKDSPNDLPNPMKDPGDANKFWHRKLNIVDSNNSPDDPSVGENDVDENTPQNQENGDFEYSGDRADSTQVLGEATEEEAVEMELPEENGDDKDEDTSEEEKQNADKEIDMNEQKNADRSQNKPKKSKPSIDQREQIDGNDSISEDGSILDERAKEDNESEGEEDDMDVEEEEESEDLITGTRVVSDLSKLRFEGNESKVDTSAHLVEDEYMANATAAEVEEARSQWLSIQGETQNLSRRLCEKLRLVMEPLVASKLRGDYRTGKRINMKRVIGYIASGYRKDKIWLRRTKPAKRNYRVLLAVDDSESMQKSGAGEMALHAMATVAVGMNQLEIGELGVASFGDDMRLVHPFHMPFTSESGASVVRNFRFQQQRTRIAMCVESAMAALEDSGDRSSMQLVFLISDGRIERDSRSALKRLIREMVERNILLAMIIVEGKGEGKGKKKDSILNMKEVTFEKGKPVVKRFIDDYPFPYYIVLDDVASLPEVLGDALKQWFEMLTQLQTS